MSGEILIVAAISGLVQGLSGFAFGLIATAFWAWMLNPQEVVPLVVMSSLVGQVVSIASVRSDIQLSNVRPFIVGGILGVPLGTAILQLFDVFIFRSCVGAGLILFALLMFRISSFPKINSTTCEHGCVGFASGFLAGACGMGGPPMTVWCSMQNWSMRVQRATFQLFFIFIQAFMLLLMFFKGMLTHDILKLFLFIAPVVVTSSWGGSILAGRLGQSGFRKIILILLLCSGCALMFPLLQTSLLR